MRAMIGAAFHDDLIALCSVVHSANQRGDRLVLALTGLPSLPRKLAEVKSYAERLVDCSSIGALDDKAAVGTTSPTDAELAVDGIDEVLTVMLVRGAPDEAASGATVAVEIDEQAWCITLEPSAIVPGARDNSGPTWCRSTHRGSPRKSSRRRPRAIGVEP